MYTIITLHTDSPQAALFTRVLCVPVSSCGFGVQGTCKPGSVKACQYSHVVLYTYLNEELSKMRKRYGTAIVPATCVVCRANVKQAAAA